MILRSGAFTPFDSLKFVRLICYIYCHPLPMLRIYRCKEQSGSYRTEIKRPQGRRIIK